MSSFTITMDRQFIVTSFTAIGSAVGALLGAYAGNMLYERVQLREESFKRHTLDDIENGLKERGLPEQSVTDAVAALRASYGEDSVGLLIRRSGVPASVSAKGLGEAVKLVAAEKK
eukprot:TRINITY_DN3882_c0_g1_i2.p6 TRINITY_DN3882_c0_g1~~TRINITY_DN3882_c0_g1_i2.p6  ORF type:complete len:116 (-),score=18.38 TRINITY_DN3882_c0_g1_i2:91-438(-)